MILPETVRVWGADGKPIVLVNLIARAYNDIVEERCNEHPLAQSEPAQRLRELVAEHGRR